MSCLEKKLVHPSFKRTFVEFNKIPISKPVFEFIYLYIGIRPVASVFVRSSQVNVVIVDMRRVRKDSVFGG